MPTNLARAWEFVSGQQATFKAASDKGAAPVFAEFSIFMPLEVMGLRRCAGVGVLMERDAALVVARHMFALPDDALKEDDLRDACCEVCNVFSDCVSPWIGGDSDVIIGLPYRVSLAEFAVISGGSILISTYQSSCTVRNIYVVVYEVFLSPQVN